jgi:Mrp family chromosome partitioning ATPase
VLLALRLWAARQLSVGLARSLATSRVWVLVIDTDPYRSQIATAFGASKFPTFGTIIEERVRLGDLVQPSQNPLLTT